MKHPFNYMGLLSLPALAALLYIPTGRIDFIGFLGFLAFFLNILGIMMPVRDHKMHGAEGGFPMLSRVAVILNALCMAGIIAVYVMGIIL